MVNTGCRRSTQDLRVIVVEKDNIFIMSNGDVLALTANSARIAGTSTLKTSMSMEIVSVKSGLLSSVTGETFRRWCRSAVATVDFKSKMILAGPDILSRGLSTCVNQGI